MSGGWGRRAAGVATHGTNLQATAAHDDSALSAMHSAETKLAQNPDYTNPRPWPQGGVCQRGGCPGAHLLLLGVCAHLVAPLEPACGGPLNPPASMAHAASAQGPEQLLVTCLRPAAAIHLLPTSADGGPPGPCTLGQHGDMCLSPKGAPGVRPLSPPTSGGSPGSRP